MPTLAEEEVEEIVPFGNGEDQGIDKLEPQYASQLPEPKGYKLLVALPDIEEATEGGIIKSVESQHEESISTVVGWVMSMGSDAYVNYARFPTGPYCQVGDWVQESKSMVESFV